MFFMFSLYCKHSSLVPAAVRCIRLGTRNPGIHFYDPVIGISVDCLFTVNLLSFFPLLNTNSKGNVIDGIGPFRTDRQREVVVGFMWRRGSPVVTQIT